MSTEQWIVLAIGMVLAAVVGAIVGATA